MTREQATALAEQMIAAANAAGATVVHVTLGYGDDGLLTLAAGPAELARLLAEVIRDALDGSFAEAVGGLRECDLTGRRSS